MSLITNLPWDTQVLGNKAGKVAVPENIPAKEECSLYNFIHVRIPQTKVELCWEYQSIGYRYVALDFQLTNEPISGYEDSTVFNSSIKKIKKSLPFFEIDGFNIEGSRLMIDPVLKKRLDKNIWDKMIYDHCLDFADFCICYIDKNNMLRGFISCFERKEEIEIFLCVVHPQHQNIGIGSSLFKYLKNYAYTQQKKITTNVLSVNTGAINFYHKQGFIINNAHIIMHYSNLNL
ncbi:MAG: GNAT family N-acetyltransferase [Gammaproteobacteria bacterium]|jgi:ribosomal protein S18 acetylase RimI-like enzyme